MRWERRRAMELPLWLSQAILNRLDEVTAKIENDSKLREIRREERRMFYDMFKIKTLYKPLNSEQFLLSIYIKEDKT
jgi:hypothetical protein